MVATKIKRYRGQYEAESRDLQEQAERQEQQVTRTEAVARIVSNYETARSKNKSFNPTYNPRNPNYEAGFLIPAIDRGGKQVEGYISISSIKSQTSAGVQEQLRLEKAKLEQTRNTISNRPSWEKSPDYSAKIQNISDRTSERSSSIAAAAQKREQERKNVAIMERMGVEPTKQYGWGFGTGSPAQADANIKEQQRQLNQTSELDATVSVVPGQTQRPEEMSDQDILERQAATRELNKEQQAYFQQIKTAANWKEALKIREAQLENKPYAVTQNVYKESGKVVGKSGMSSEDSIEWARANLAYQESKKEQDRLEAQIDGINRALTSEKARLEAEGYMKDGETVGVIDGVPQSARYQELLELKSQRVAQLQAATAQKQATQETVIGEDIIGSTQQSFSGISGQNPMETQTQFTPYEASVQTPESRAKLSGETDTLVDPQFKLTDYQQKLSASGMNPQLTQAQIDQIRAEQNIGRTEPSVASSEGFSIDEMTRNIERMNETGKIKYEVGDTARYFEGMPVDENYEGKLSPEQITEVINSQKADAGLNISGTINEINQNVRTAAEEFGVSTNTGSSTWSQDGVSVDLSETVAKQKGDRVSAFSSREDADKLFSIPSMSNLILPQAYGESAEETQTKEVEKDLSPKDWVGGEITAIPDDIGLQIQKGFTADAFNLTQMASGFATGTIDEKEYAPTLIGDALEAFLLPAMEQGGFKEITGENPIGDIGQNFMRMLEVVQTEQYQQDAAEEFGQLAADIQKYPAYYVSSGIFEIGTAVIPPLKAKALIQSAATVARYGKKGVLMPQEEAKQVITTAKNLMPDLAVETKTVGKTGSGQEVLVTMKAGDKNPELSPKISITPKTEKTIIKKPANPKDPRGTIPRYSIKTSSDAEQILTKTGEGQYLMNLGEGIGGKGSGWAIIDVKAQKLNIVGKSFEKLPSSSPEVLAQPIQPQLLKRAEQIGVVQRFDLKLFTETAGDVTTKVSKSERIGIAATEKGVDVMKSTDELQRQALVRSVQEARYVGKVEPKLPAAQESILTGRVPKFMREYYAAKGQYEEIAMFGPVQSLKQTFPRQAYSWFGQQMQPLTRLQRIQQSQKLWGKSLKIGGKKFTMKSFIPKKIVTKIFGKDQVFRPSWIGKSKTYRVDPKDIKGKKGGIVEGKVVVKKTDKVEFNIEAAKLQKKSKERLLKQIRLEKLLKDRKDKSDKSFSNFWKPKKPKDDPPPSKDGQQMKDPKDEGLGKTTDEEMRKIAKELSDEKALLYAEDKAWAIGEKRPWISRGVPDEKGSAAAKDDWWFQDPKFSGDYVDASLRTGSGSTTVASAQGSVYVPAQPDVFISYAEETQKGSVAEAVESVAALPSVMDDISAGLQGIRPEQAELSPTVPTVNPFASIQEPYQSLESGYRTGPRLLPSSAIELASAQVESPKIAMSLITDLEQRQGITTIRRTLFPPPRPRPPLTIGTPTFIPMPKPLPTMIKPPVSAPAFWLNYDNYPARRPKQKKGSKPKRKIEWAVPDVWYGAGYTYKTDKRDPLGLGTQYRVLKKRGGVNA